jgi:cell wall-associated NlpC family hydrolase
LPEPGQIAAVTVSVATLWHDPSRVRPQDASALATPARVRDWTAGMDTAAQDDLHGRILTQLLLGEEVRVDEVRDGWARVVATAQPAPKLDDTGYPGWLPAAQLGTPAEPAEPYLVDATATALRDEPQGDLVMTGVVIGTRLDVAGPAYVGWVPVYLPGRDDPAWAVERDLSPLLEKPGPTEDLVPLAERFLDVAYLWGGMSPFGIDCSGLVHLTARRLGRTLPRDADEQALATVPVPLGEERAGDLYFFSRDGDRPGHVGIVTAPGEMLHASGAARRVVQERLTDDRQATLVGVGRLIDT